MKKQYTIDTLFDTIRKLTLIIAVMIISGNIFAQQLKGKRIDVDLQKGTLVSLLQQIEKRTNCNMIYINSQVELKNDITINMKNSTVEDILKIVLKNSELKFLIEGNTVTISKDIANVRMVKPLEFNLKGKIIDEITSNPVVGATIVVDGTNRGTITDGNGAFEIKIAVDDVIEINCVGMLPNKVKITTQKTNLIIELKRDVIAVENVVVTGYQTISRERNAGSFKVVAGEDVAVRAQAQGSILEGLEGIATGLLVNFSSGSQKVTMRGVNSINSNTEVLYVIDGVPISGGTLEDMVNSNDIESISVLKDATAASIWGSRAANGVIVVTTKKGSKGQEKIKITYDGNYIFRGKPDYDHYDLMDSPTLVKTFDEISKMDGFASNWSFKPNATGGINPLQDILFNVKDPVERERQLAILAGKDGIGQAEDILSANAFSTSHSLSFTGGTNYHQYYGSIFYENNQNASRDTYDKIIANFRQNFSFTDWLKLDVGINFSNIKTNTSNNPINLNSPSLVIPYLTLLDDNGEYSDHSDKFLNEDRRGVVEQQSGIDLSYFPMLEKDYRSNTSNRFNYKINTGLNINLAKGLKFNTLFQYQESYNNIDNYLREESYTIRKERATLTSYDKSDGTRKEYLPNKGSNYYFTDGRSNDWTIRNQFMYDNILSEKHQITAMLGTEQRGYKITSYSDVIRGYDEQTLTYVPYDERTALEGIKNSAYTDGTGKIYGSRFKSQELEERYVSFYANTAYSYDNKYSFNGSIRVDQSNLFGTDKSARYKPLWSLGAMWNISNETFMSSVKWLDNLAFRVSYGIGGTTPDPGSGGPFDIITASTKYLPFLNDGLSYLINTYANKSLVWEKTATFNIGIDFRIFDNRLRGSFEYYNKNTTDLLIDIDSDPTQGSNRIYGNAGSLYNRGFEIALNSINIRKKNFIWTTDLTLSTNKNEITKLNIDPSTISFEQWPKEKYLVGYPINPIMAYEWGGLDSNGNSQFMLDGKAYSSISATDLNTNKIQFLGSINPTCYGAITNKLQFQNFEFSFMFIYSLGHKMRKPIQQSASFSSNLLNDFDDRWRKPGDENITDIPRWSPSSIDNLANIQSSRISQYSDRNVLDASYIKLRDISISYILANKIFTNVLESVRFKFQVGNLHTFVFNDEGIDPESVSLSSGNRTALYGPSFIFGLNIRFK